MQGAFDNASVGRRQEFRSGQIELDEFVRDAQPSMLVAIEQVVSAVTRLRQLSPLWEMAQEGIDIKSIKWAEH